MEFKKTHTHVRNVIKRIVDWLKNYSKFDLKRTYKIV